MSEYIMYKGRMVFRLPEEFEIMNAEETKAVYGNDLFDYSFADKMKKAYVNIKIHDSHLETKDVEKRISEYYNLYAQIIPDVEMGELQLSEQEGRNFGFLSFRSDAPSRKVYNFVAVTCLDSKELFMMFTCDLKDVVLFYPQFIRIVNQTSFHSKNDG